MCGLVGFIAFQRPIATFKNSLDGFINQALYVGGVRGRDSTGIFTLARGENETNVVKNAVDGSIFIDQYNVQQVMQDIGDYNFIIGHHRKATKGAITTRNAHPFRVGPITLVHNGSLLNHRTLAGGNSLTVDSEAIAHALATHEAKEVMEQLDGAFALIWHDARDNSLSIARNAERPLAMGLIETEETLVIASEVGMLRWLAGRNDLGVSTYLEVTQDNILKWDLNNKSVKARGYTTEAFTSKKAQWAATSQRSTATGTGKSTTASSPNTSSQLNQVLSKYSLNVGDLIEFTGTEYYPYTTKITHGALHGLDIAGSFEVIAYDVVQGDYTGSLLESRIISVLRTNGYPDWITVVVDKDVKIKQRDYRKKSSAEIQQDIARTKKERAKAAKKREETAANKEEQSGPKAGKVKCAYNCTHECPSCRNARIARGEGTKLLPSQSAYSHSPGGHSSSTGGDHKTSGGGRVSGSGRVLDFVAGPQGIMITQREWKEATKDGCSYCCCDLKTPAEVIWTFNGEPLCYDCDRLYNQGTGSRIPRMQ